MADRVILSVSCRGRQNPISRDSSLVFDAQLTTRAIDRPVRLASTLHCRDLRKIAILFKERV